jgi:phosphoribosylamine--glycine ligase
MKVLVVGGGGREHALCWKLRQSPSVKELYCASGSAAIGDLADLVPVAPEETHKLASFAADLKIDLTVVGPELPLTLGIVDEFQHRGLPIFGPSRQAAELEGSKVFAKQFMERHGVPTAPFQITHDREEAAGAARELGWPVVLKADGLAGGKGVLICRDEEELQQALGVLFDERRFGAASDRVLVEGFLEGEEVSFMALCDGERILPLATSKDYKRLGDRDTGPNTGGMGSHSPSGLLPAEQGAQVVERILRPTVSGMAAEGRPFVGFLYAGLMLTAQGPQVLEYNVRLGDPEAQCLLLRLQDDLVPILANGVRGGFNVSRLQFRKEAAACIVLASRGYPGKPVKGEAIEGLDRAAREEGVQIFHAGTAFREGRYVATGGRVLNVCATGPRLVDALKRAYAAAGMIEWPSKVLRRDIGRAVLTGEGHREGLSHS